MGDLKWKGWRKTSCSRDLQLKISMSNQPDSPSSITSVRVDLQINPPATNSITRYLCRWLAVLRSSRAIPIRLKASGHRPGAPAPISLQTIRTTVEGDGIKNLHDREMMACTGIQPSLRRLVLDASRTREIPSFLLPSISFRSFSSGHAQRSRIGREPITIPPEVNLRFFDLPKGISRSRNPDTATSALEVTGPLGEYDKHISLTWCGRLIYIIPSQVNSRSPSRRT